MKIPLSKAFAALGLLINCAAQFPALASAQTPITSPAPAALEIQISAPQRNGKNFLAFNPTHWHLNVILRNISSKPFQLIEEGNSWGYDNLHLEITSTDGKPLAAPLMVLRPGPQIWRSNVFTTQTLAPNQSVVREVRFHVPTAIKHPLTPPTEEESEYDKRTDFVRQDGEYWFFPFQSQTVTMRAIFQAPIAKFGVWGGRIESPLLTYELGN